MLLDAIELDLPIEQKALIHGDTRSVSIAAASILAKVERDRRMEEFDQIYPQYGLAQHKGYGTPEHLAALRQHGPTPAAPVLIRAGAGGALLGDRGNAEAPCRSRGIGSSGFSPDFAELSSTLVPVIPFVTTASAVHRPFILARANLMSQPAFRGPRGGRHCHRRSGRGRRKSSMAFNKSKALENALKFLNQGKVPQAIAEYQQILRNDGKDQATLMTVGDLYARQGDMSHAIEYFERLAQVYLNDGFNSKAIAIYKKIAKLAPNELAPLERLADLYVQQGVLSEARPLFLQIAEAHLKANHAQKAVEVLHRLLDVEPENLRVQMRLAELYNVMGQKKEAAQTYLNYAQRLLDRGEHDEAAKLVERALEVDPDERRALSS